MADVTALLPAALGGDEKAQNELFRLVEPELRQLAWHWLLRLSAQERVEVSDVLDRVFIKLMNIDSPNWKHRGQFYSYACRNIPCVLIDLLRAQDRARKMKQVGTEQQALLQEMPGRVQGPSDASLLSLTQALEELERELSPLHRQLVELKYIGELTLDDIAEITALHRSSIDRKLNVARGFLREALKTSFPDFGRFAASAEETPDG